MIKEIHNAVRGRIRYKVEGLYRSAPLKRRLEARLSEIDDINSVSANILTGSLLVLFSPECNPRKIYSIVAQVAVDHMREVESRTTEVSEISVEGGAARQESGRAGETKIAYSPMPVRGSQQQKSEPWHLMHEKFVLAALNSSAETGLTPDAAKKSAEKYGLNIVPEPASRSKLDIFIDQFKSLPVALLAGAAGLSIVTGGAADALVIMAVVGINAVIGFATESEAEKTINSLKQMIRPYAMVVREGEPVEIAAEQVLVGDILLLKPGTFITADARVLQTVHLSVDESSLTGESMPVSKKPAALVGTKIPLADRVNMVYSGTLVTGGQGLAVVVATGPNSELGKVQTLVAESEAPETPVERQLNTIGNQLVVISGAVCGLVFVIGLLRGNGFIQMLKTAISLAVAAVPEGLPAVATTTLALGIKNMRRHHVIIRNLDAVCTLGSLQTICFDKTGTITRNKMSVLRVYSGMRQVDVKAIEYESTDQDFNFSTADELLKLLHVCLLCNETQVDFHEGQYVLNGSATENALIYMAIGSGIDVQALRRRYPLLETTYRSDNRQFMTTLHSNGGEKTLVALKGSPAEVLAMCEYHVVNGRETEIADEDRETIETENEHMAGDTLRVLGVAYSFRNGEGSVKGQGQEEYTWLGLVGMADPIRDRVKESIMAFHEAGLETVMITGDQSATAYAVGKELGLSNGDPLEILDSTHLTGTDPGVVMALSKQVHVFSRVSPSNKLQIVQALQSSGKVVAMTGDGINDGPALKAADIGIAMGRTGTDVAREVADVVLEEDNLETLIIAIRDGRTIYDNIRKTLHYLLSTNFSEIQVMFIAGALGLGYPLNAMQLLWINLVSDIFPGLALALEPAESGVMKRDPRDPLEPIVKTEDFKRITFEAAAMTMSSLVSYGYGVARYGMGANAGTMAFQSLTTSQILHALSCRSEKRVIFGSSGLPSNKYLNIAIISSLGMQALTQLVPGLRSLLGLTPLTLLDGLVIGATSIIPLLVNEATKKNTVE